MVIEKIDDKRYIDAFASIRHLPLPVVFSGGNPPRRRSILAADPFITLKSRGRRVAVKYSGGKEESFDNDPFDVLSGILADIMAPGISQAFGGGLAAGYFSYDLKDVIEPGNKASLKKTSLELPDCVVGLYDPLFIYDHFEESGYIVSQGRDSKRLQRFRSSLLKKNTAKGAQSHHAPDPAKDGIRSDFTKEGYIEAIRRAKQYISSGDIYQINLSQRLEIPWKGDPFGLYLSLLKKHPGVFSSFMDIGDFQILSNSPERLLKIEDGWVETSPIKGTRPRGKDPDEDKRFIKELKSSIKERAEHVMIVDLERNDLGRISAPGTVEVTDFETIETFSHLHHMVSTVRGRLVKRDPSKALKAVFPGGSVTGAPKIRAMEIIDELEPAKREIYTGGIGWIGFNGDMDIAMAIRTAIYKDNTIYLNVGGGIVADSIPVDEYEETILKAGDLLSVLGMSSKIQRL